ncbi:MAG: T9SS type A sorting domain-containing protein [Bacteroidales bacterium]|nr:T9SS type A sorting domain-containing protein [Bacteroidales bacterium]
MKKAVFTIYLIYIVFFHNAFSQEFSFTMTFCDAVGNTDTLTIGYDTTATDSLDSEFGEINIIDIELDSVFDIRVTNEWKIRAWIGYQYKSKYHLKKQIVNKNCDTWADPVSIDIKCSHWPVTAKWDSNLFIGDPCREGSVFTSLNPGCWWDVCGKSSLYYCIFSEQTKVTFSSNADEYFYPGDFGQDSYINSDHDTISVFWVAIGTNAIWSYIDKDTYDNYMVLYPNPSHDYIRIDFKNSVNIKSIEVYNLTGRKQDVAVRDNEIDISKLINGFYYVRIINNENRILVRKFIKY